MKLRNIMNSDELNQVADMWYKRTLDLRDIWQDENETSERRIKAYALWETMKNRVFSLIPILLKLRAISAIKGFKPGGVIVK